MNFTIKAFLICSIFTFVGIGSGAAQDEIVIHVKFKASHAARMSHKGIVDKFGLDALDKLNTKRKNVGSKRLFPDAGKFEAAHRAYGLHQWYELRFNSDQVPQQLIKEYNSLNYFERVEERKEYVAINGASPDPIPTTLTSPTSDPRFVDQWHFKNTGQNQGTPGADIDLVKAWTLQTGDPRVIVAVIDAGVDVTHPDLAANMWVNSGEIRGNLIDDDHNGYIDDVNGYGFGDQTPILWPHVHATHVAGTIAAVTNNGVGVSGIAGGNSAQPGARVMSLAGFGNFQTGGFEEAMVYAADNGAVISQNSWGGGSTSIQSAIDYFIARAGLDNTTQNFSQNIQTGPMAGGIVIFAAGNDNSNDPAFGYPASYPPVMAVASTQKEDLKSSFSNFGPWVDISAPGEGIMSTLPSSSYGFLSGTSMACPHVSGVAALIVSQYAGPSLTPAEVWNRLIYSSDLIDLINPSFTGLLGYGRLNAYNALLPPPVAPPSQISNLNIDRTGYNSVTLSWNAPANASRYDVRFSRSPIDATNFSSATQATGEPIPGTAGTVENLIVRNLAPFARYYFAIRTTDMGGNISAISNIVTTTTVAAPSFTTTPGSLSEALYTGQKSTRNLTIKNVGGTELMMSLGLTNFNPSSIDSFSQATVMAEATPGLRAGGKLFAVNTTTNMIESIDPASGATLESYPLPAPTNFSPEGLAYDGTYLYYTNSGGTKKIYKIDPRTGLVVGTHQLSESIYRIYGLAHSGTYLYAIEHTSGKILEINFTTGTERLFGSGMSGGGGLTFGGKRGTLFVAVGETIREIDRTTGQTLKTIPGTPFPTGLAYSNATGVLFLSGSQTNILALNPDTGEHLYILPFGFTNALASDEALKPWVELGIGNVTLQPGASANVPVKFDATGLTGTTYQAAIRVSTNEQDAGFFTVPVSLTVTRGSRLDISDLDIQFADQLVGQAVDSIITLENNGVDPITVTSIISNNPTFTLSSAGGFVLLPGQKQDLSIKYNVIAGPSSATITIVSNDPVQANYMINASGNGLASNPINLSMSSLDITLLTGETSSADLTISNSGSSNLIWKSEVKGSTIKLASADAPLTSAVGEVTLKASSPTQVEALAADPTTGFIYAQAVNSNLYYRYNPFLNSWQAMAMSPIHLDYLAVYHNGKIYGIYTNPNSSDPSKVAVYDIATNSWSLVTSTLLLSPSVLASDGSYLYVRSGPSLYRWNPDTADLEKLVDAPRNYAGVSSHHNGVLYGQAGSGYPSTNTTEFYKYFIATNEWTVSTEAPAESFDGSAIDAANKLFYMPRKTGGFLVYDMRMDFWSTLSTGPIPSVGGLVYVGKEGVSGIYFTGAGITFGRLETKAQGEWLTLSPNSGTVSPSGDEHVTMNFNATGLDAGVYPGSVKIMSTASPVLNREVAVNLTVVGAPDIKVDRNNIVIRPWVIGMPIGENFKVYNIGSDVLSISQISSDNIHFLLSKSSLTLYPGQSTTVSISFVPTDPVLETAKISLHSNDPNDPVYEITVSGQSSLPPNIEVSPASLDVSANSGDLVIRQVTITNTGGSTCECAVNNPGSWVKPTPGYANIPAGESRTINIAFDANGLNGGYSGSFELAHHIDYFKKYLPVTFTVASAANITTDKAAIIWGNRHTNKPYDTLVSIKNKGIQPLVISNASSDATGFSVTPASMNVGAGASGIFTIRFNPLSTGPFIGNITFISNAASLPQLVIPVSGTGVAPPVIGVVAPSFNVSTEAGESVTRTLTISNSGGAPLNWKVKSTASLTPMSVVDGDATGVLEPLSPGDITSKAPSPASLRCVTSYGNNIYAQRADGAEFYRYSPGTNAWETLQPSPISAAGAGTAAYLVGHLYTAYQDNDTQIGQYNIAGGTWKTINSQLGSATNAMGSDGTYLYFASGSTFKRFDPGVGQWIDRATPPIQFSSGGGLSYLNGALYGHAGNGSNQFARYIINGNYWELLPSIPGSTVVGSTIDYIRNQFYAYGPAQGSNLYIYEVLTKRWSKREITKFAVNNGGMVYLNTAGFSGVYFAEGSGGNGFARYETRDTQYWLKTSHDSGTIPAGESFILGVNLDAAGMAKGTYAGSLQFTTNDPLTTTLNLPATLAVTYTGPDISTPASITQTIPSSTPRSFPFTITNSGERPLNWSFGTSLPSWLKPDKNSGAVPAHGSSVVTLTVSPLGVGIYNYPIVINSDDLYKPVKNIDLKVTVNVNRAPRVILAIPQTVSLNQGGLVYFTLLNRVIDDDGDPLTFTVTDSPLIVAGMIDPENRLKLTGVAGGTAIIKVTATDPAGATAFLAFTAVVAATPSTTVGLEQSISSTTFNVSPNPLDSKAVIQYAVSSEGNFSVVVHDALGKIVWRRDAYDDIGMKEHTIDGNLLSAGIYFATLIKDGRPLRSVRFVKR